MMTKQEEIDHFAGFYADLPASSYLHDILADLPQFVETMIRNDFSYPCLTTLRDRIAEARIVSEKLRAARLELADLESRTRGEREVIKRFQATSDNLKSHINSELKDAAGRIAGLALR